jgi:hypothetical protein
MDNLLSLKACFEQTISNALQKLWGSWHWPRAKEKAHLNINNY